MRTCYLLILLSACALAGCSPQSPEHDLLLKYRSEDTIIREMEKYDLEMQYRIFREGNDAFHPPMTGLAEPIAKKGTKVIPFLMQKLREEPGNDIALRDTLCVLEAMARDHHYDVKSDTKLMDELTELVSNAREWKLTLHSQLDLIKQQ